MKEKRYEAVVACGGLGTRLKNITGTIPKPLFPINGKSTIERCIEEIKNNSISSVLITLGYKNESFLKFIKELEKKFSINIDIFVEKNPLGECGALWLIKENLNNDFFFINGDLIFSIDFNRLICFHKRLASNLTLVTHTSDHPNDSDLISAPNGTLIEDIFIKDSSKKIDRYGYLGNSGICLINKSLLEAIKPPKINQSNSIFHHIVKNAFHLNKNIFSYNTTEYIKDMGTPERFNLVKEDLALNKVNLKNYNKKQKALFLDRDNTLIRCDIGKYILSENQIEFIDENINRISLIAKEFDLVCLVTNQPVISMGKLTIYQLEKINSNIVKYCLTKGLKIDVITYCPHHPHKGFKNEVKILKKDCFCRKPNPGLILEQAFLRNVNLKDSLMIGDSDNDSQAAEKSGCNFIYVDSL
tara:strand:- start:596 stop:1840 length:1245 start_codon:yes stop_codon:yes gene_type:complete